MSASIWVPNVRVMQREDSVSKKAKNRSAIILLGYHSNKFVPLTEMCLSNWRWLLCEQRTNILFWRFDNWPCSRVSSRSLAGNWIVCLIKMWQEHTQINEQLQGTVFMSQQNHVITNTKKTTHNRNLIQSFSRLSGTRVCFAQAKAHRSSSPTLARGPHPRDNGSQIKNKDKLT